MKKLALIFATAATLLVGCSKDDDNNNGGGNGNETVNYLPVKAGNTWTYKLTNLINNNTSNYTLTSTNSTKTINGKNFIEFTSSAGASLSEFYNIEGKSYTQYGNVANFNNLEFNYLAGNNNVGDKWVQTGIAAKVSGYDATLNINYEIINKLATTTVAGKTYNDVLVVKMTFSDLKIMGSVVTFKSQAAEIYIAKNIGKIKQSVNVEVNLPVSGNSFNSTIELTDSKITL